jgi:RHS repeat-associated protein
MVLGNLHECTNSNQAQSFGYDWLNRLTSASTNAAGAGQYDHSYTYDAIGNPSASSGQAITSFAGNSYTYGDPAHKHAVTSAFGNSYAYDANGNQTSRTIGGVTYTFAYDYENRLTSITGAGVSATFVYDADGQRVKGTVNGVSTVYIAGVYEWQGGATTIYYEGNAIRRSGYASDNGVFYNLRDHLSSSSVLLNQNATVNGNRNYFFPFGGNRGGAAFSSLTTKRFTGQYHESTLPGGEGLSYYGARWYDAQLERFLSADTIVPGPANPQAFNRYSYVLNSPTNRIDPTGHYDVRPGDDPWWKNLGGGSTKIYLPLIANPTAPRTSASDSGRPSVPANHNPATYPSRSVESTPSRQSRDWRENARAGVALAKAVTKRYWGCGLLNCSISTEDWTGSVDVGAMLAPLGPAVRLQGSIAVDHQGGIALVGSWGGGGSTPVFSGGLSITGTNAPSVDNLAGQSVQAGGTAASVFAGEAIIFKDSTTGQYYYGLSVAPLSKLSFTYLPPPLEGSVHGTVMNSQVYSANVFDWLFAPLEWFLKED